MKETPEHLVILTAFTVIAMSTTNALAERVTQLEQFLETAPLPETYWKERRKIHQQKILENLETKNPGLSAILDQVLEGLDPASE